MKLNIKPLTLKQANEFVGEHHRHHKPVVGHRFSLGAFIGESLRGVIIVGRPVARMTSQYDVAEVTRCCTDGTNNACSFLYGAAARVCRAMGFKTIQTYTLPEEGGGSLRGAGWKLIGEAGGGDWNRGGQSTHKNRRTDQPMTVKHKYEKYLF